MSPGNPKPEKILYILLSLGIWLTGVLIYLHVSGTTHCPERARIEERDYKWNYKLTVDYSFAVHVCIRFRQIPRISGRSYRFTKEWCHNKADLSPASSSGSSMWRCDGINLRYYTVVWTIPQFGFSCRTQKSCSLVIYILCSLIWIVALQRL